MSQLGLRPRVLMSARELWSHLAPGDPPLSVEGGESEVLSLGFWRGTDLRTSAGGQFSLLFAGPREVRLPRNGPPACVSWSQAGPELGRGCGDPATAWARASVIPGVRTLGGSALCNSGALPLPAASSRPEKYDDRYRYDPRFTGSFDDEPEPPRDPYGEEADRHSEHSQHSARSLRSAPSLPSRRSSFSAHSHQVGGAGSGATRAHGGQPRGVTFWLCAPEESGVPESQHACRVLRGAPCTGLLPRRLCLRPLRERLPRRARLPRVRLPHRGQLALRGARCVQRGPGCARRRGGPRSSWGWRLRPQ